MKAPIIYLCIHERLKEKFRFEAFSNKELLLLLGKVYHIKKKYHYSILQELENFNLISKVSRNQMVLIKSKVDLDDTSKIYQGVGLY